ncbi:MAG: aldo/keto reductase [Clostridia bacterium]|nr:aldo/keto reductase [Clostridia bacterium]
METMKINNGNIIPTIGLGTWLIKNNKVADIIKTAVKLGYRHIDTAQAYENEEGVGLGIKECGIPREELYITTKVRAELKDYDSAYNSVIESLEKMNLSYVDLILIHSPEPWREFRTSKKDYYKENAEVWHALEKLYSEGKVKAIGVSNFHISDIENILKNCTIKPMVNQVLAHVGQVPFEIVNYCKENDILIEAYSPIAHGEAKRLKKVNEIADKYNKTFAQICLKYLIQLGMVVLPKASSEEHLANNFDLDFVISEEDMQLLNTVKPLKNYGLHDFFPVFKHSGE